jgi:hypothetical protein
MYPVNKGLLLQYCRIVKQQGECRQNAMLTEYLFMDKLRRTLHEQLVKDIPTDKQKQFQFWLANIVEDFIKE